MCVCDSAGRIISVHDVVLYVGPRGYVGGSTKSVFSKREQEREREREEWGMRDRERERERERERSGE